MVTAKCKVGDGDFACVGKGGARPRSNLNPLGVASDERFEIEYSSRGSIDQKPLLGRANANFDDGKAVAPFDGALVGKSRDRRINSPLRRSYTTHWPFIRFADIARVTA